MMLLLGECQAFINRVREARHKTTGDSLKGRSGNVGKYMYTSYSSHSKYTSSGTNTSTSTKAAATAVTTTQPYQPLIHPKVSGSTTCSTNHLWKPTLCHCTTIPPKRKAHYHSTESLPKIPCKMPEVPKAETSTVFKYDFHLKPNISREEVKTLKEC